MRTPLHRIVLIWSILGVSALAAAQGTDPSDRRAVKLLFDSWKLPVPPRKLIGNIYYVGAAGVSSYLITTPQGHILIDTAFEDTVPQTQKGIEELGFKVTDIKFILSSHAHNDHVGGHALMKKLSGAKVVASELDAHVMETGGDDDFSPFVKDMMHYTPLKADQIIADGDKVELGGVTLTAHLTPGHTKGATTWTMKVRDGEKSYDVVFFSSTSISRGTRLLGNREYPNIVKDFEATFETLKKLPCDVWFAPHGGQFAMTDKFNRLDKPGEPNPFIDPDGWKRMIAGTEKAFRDQLATEGMNVAP